MCMCVCVHVWTCVYMHNICIRRVVHFSNSLLSLSFLSPQQRVPNNTPATPSQLPDILSSLSQMTTSSESMERSHGQWMDRRERCSSGAELGELMTYQDQSSNQTQSLVVPGMHPDLPPQEMSDPQSVYEPSQPPQQQPQVQPYSFYGQAPNVTSSSWVPCVLPPTLLGACWAQYCIPGDCVLASRHVDLDQQWIKHYGFFSEFSVFLCMALLVKNFEYHVFFSFFLLFV